MPHKIRNYWVLAASIFFYSWGAPKFVFVVVASVVINFYLIQILHKSDEQKKRKVLLAISIAFNIFLLLYFKYANFFVENVNQLLLNLNMKEMYWTKVALPIGISFYTFQTLTYSIDVYRKANKPLKNPFQYLLYILLFPQLIAGPIVRFGLVADQIEDRREFETIDNKLLGLFRFVIGLAKKVLIANTLGAEADFVFSKSASEMDTAMAWIGILAYNFQIYFDFSGYSDMAIGIGRMIGFKFPENFNNPYISQSITEFWKRWHITLGSWMRDYLYIPLGGSRTSSKGRLYFNLWFVFLISGLWHGAAWNFVVWGIYHGVFLIIDRLFYLNFSRKIGKYPSIVITFLVTLIGWVIFRAETLGQAIDYLGIMFSFSSVDVFHNVSIDFWTILLMAATFSFLTLSKWGLKWEKNIFYSEKFSIKGYVVMSFVILILLSLSIGFITSSDFNPFIYFRF
jgi:alginate O-acetyltransferase complex protein AlgI